MKNKYEVYTDGATSNNGSDQAYGGWAAVFTIDETLDHAYNGGLMPPTTNNICELTAIQKACELAQISNKLPITVYSDSAYIINCYKQKWYKKWQENGWLTSNHKPVANKELWEQIIPFFEDENYSFEKIKGHVGHIWNELADKEAVAAKKEVEKYIERGEQW